MSGDSKFLIWLLVGLAVTGPLALVLVGVSWIVLRAAGGEKG